MWDFCFNVPLCLICFRCTVAIWFCSFFAMCVVKLQYNRFCFSNAASLSNRLLIVAYCRTPNQRQATRKRVTQMTRTGTASRQITRRSISRTSRENCRHTVRRLIYIVCVRQCVFVILARVSEHTRSGFTARAQYYGSDTFKDQE